jgi:HEAT repeats
MSSADEYAAYYLERLRQGHFEDAFFGLIEADPAVLPVLMDAFAKEEDRDVRAEIVRCIWQHRRPETVSFLADLLHDPEPAIWRAALDGLVAIGGDQAVQALRAARARTPAGRAGRAITLEWVDEALEQAQGKKGSLEF